MSTESDRELAELVGDALRSLEIVRAPKSDESYGRILGELADGGEVTSIVPAEADRENGAAS
ncbi:hypothetical protein SAMN06297251_103275 [Fulvimarina manganoxydans]|uniref:Uncharacterized protein n=1 Tax=Fulvimarina manganoxydans TaxID=937218 RepID=A0A1W2A0K4_9HYPH|nr:hypothetical protein [Fulvimarina manganoxydans]MEE2951988.1 hypothetical protein [Pseudomonadota bacterium]SMC54235.1 hypothetical protein SAMN06297251_103275 [Fulvimarina manganoxydans]